MVMQRYDPSRNAVSLRAMMDHLFDESFLRPFGNSAMEAALALDVSETNDAYTVKASMPGAKPDDVQITANGNTITIKADTQAEQENKEGDYLIRERRAGHFERTFTLPMGVDADKADAKFEDGVLILTIPKSEKAKAKQIKVRNSAPLLQR